MIDLRLGNCIEVMKSIPDKSVDLIITDPPYQIQHFGGGAFGTNQRAYRNEIQPLCDGISDNVLDECRRVMKKVNIYIWCNKDQLRQYLNYFADCNCTLLTWHKTNPTPACANVYLADTEYVLYFREKGVKLYGSYETKRRWYVSKVNTEDKKFYKHPTIKPLNIIKNLVINSSVGGALVLDPFMGSGTTGVACQELDRDFIGIEINPEYYEIAKRRMSEQQLRFI